MDVLVDNAGLYVDGFFVSLQICAYALVGSLILGIAIAACRVSPVPPLRWFGTAWVTVLRNCPLTIVLFFFAFGIPEVGLNASFFTFAVTGLVFYTSAFVCEAVRSGIGAVPAGQAEAARSLGLTFVQVLRLVVLPQALRTVVPPLGSVLIAMFKNSAIVGAVGVTGDLYSVGARLTSAQGFPPLPVYIGVCLGYLAITLPSAGALAVLERRTRVLR